MTEGRDRTPGRGLGTGWLAALSAAAAVLIVSLLLVAARPESLLLTHPMIEDAFYALTVARNLADGSGLTIDGNQLTNGFQPLFTIVEALPFLGGLDTVTSLRLVTVMQVVVLAAAAALMGSLLRSQLGRSGRDGWITLLSGGIVLLGSFFVINTGLNGLETGALLLAYAATWLYFQTRGVDRTSDVAILGVLMGLTVLVRIDAAVVVLVLLVVVWRAGGVIRAVAAGAVAALVASPWFIFNLMAFGSIVPSSGTAQTAVEASGFRLVQMLEAWSVVLMPWLPLGRFGGTGALIIRFAVIALVLVLLARTHPFRSASDRARRGWLFAGAFLVGYSLLAVYYGTTSYAFWFYGRYMAPLALLSAFVVGYVLLHHLTRLRVSIVIALAAIGAMVGVLHWVPGFYDRNEMLEDQVPLVRETVPEGVTVAAGQTGTLGFFRDNVVNLDGKVNPEALENRDDITSYLRDGGVDWVCDWPTNIEKYLGPGWPGWVEVAQRGQFVCVTRVP